MMRQTTTEVFEKLVANHSQERYVLCLHIAGLTPRSTLAIDRIRAICESYLSGRYELSVIDPYFQPEMARLAQIVFAPTLVKQSPSPKRLFIGDITDETRILQGLQIVSGTVPCQRKPPC